MNGSVGDFVTLYETHAQNLTKLPVVLKAKKQTEVEEPVKQNSVWIPPVQTPLVNMKELEVVEV